MANEGIDVEARASLQNLSIEGEIDGNELRYGPTKLYDYEKLFNKPQIEGVTLIGNKRLSDLGLKKATSSSDGLMSKSDKAKLDGISSSAGSNVVATESADGLMSAADKTKLDSINPSEIATNTENIKKNADKIAKLNSATAEYRLMINPETGHMALAHYTKEA